MEKRSAGSLTLNNANTYTGTAIIEAGALKGAVADALSAATDLVLNSGAKLELTVDQRVKTLTLNGKLMKRNNCTWGATGSNPTFLNTAFTNLQQGHQQRSALRKNLEGKYELRFTVLR